MANASAIIIGLERFKLVADSLRRRGGVTAPTILRNAERLLYQRLLPHLFMHLTLRQAMACLRVIRDGLASISSLNISGCYFVNKMGLEWWLGAA